MTTSDNHPRAAGGSRMHPAQQRAQAYAATGVLPYTSVRTEAGVPLGLSRSMPFESQMRAELVTRDDREFYRVEGYATVFDVGYTMWDWYGEYTEYVDTGAADETLAANPDVVFLVNHKGLSMARTASKTLELSADSTGMLDVGWLNPERQDVKDLVLAIGDGTVTEQSFAFQITEGWWNQDFTEFRIISFDIHRGDVSAVNFGANPHTSIAARQRDLFAELDLMPAYAARAAIERLTARSDLYLKGGDLGVATTIRNTGPDAETFRGTIEQAQDRLDAMARVEPAGGRSITQVEALLRTFEA